MLRQHIAGGHSQGSEQDIIMGDPFPMGQHGLGSLQSLDLLLLIHAEDDGMIRWSQVETHPLLYLIYKIGIVEDLEMPSVMGLQIEQLEPPMDGEPGDARVLGHDRDAHGWHGMAYSAMPY